MELQDIGRRAARFIEQKITHEGRILARRVWGSGGFYEIDVQLPSVKNMASWQKVQRIVVRVATLTFRDYTPAMWDPRTGTCTLFIDALHDGPGAVWARSAKPGDPLNFGGPDGVAHQSLDLAHPIVFLGDGSAIGHFLALRQLAGPGLQNSGAIFLAEAEHRAAFSTRLPELGLQVVDSEAGLFDWAAGNDISQEAACYLVGRSRLVADLRRSLRGKGIRTIKAQGFWK